MPPIQKNRPAVPKMAILRIGYHLLQRLARRHGGDFHGLGGPLIRRRGSRSIRG